MQQTAFCRWASAAFQRFRHALRPFLQQAPTSLVLGVVLLTSFVTAQANLSLSPMQTQGKPGTPNRFDPRTNTTSVSHPQPGSSPTTGTPPPPVTFQRNSPVPMQPATLDLQAGTAAHFLGSDGQLEVSVSAGAVTNTDLAQAQGGHLRLSISQILPASGSSAGGSGHVSFGTYLFQLVDGSGKPVSHGLRQPVTLALHVGKAGSALDLTHAVVVFNAGLPAGATSQTRSTLGGPHTQATTLDPANQTLAVNTTLTTASTTASFNTNAPVASFGNPDPFNVGLNTGSLTFSQPIDVPAGPGGLTPPINLNYSSAAVSEQHNIQAAAPWVGEGWNLSLGAISWAEHNVTAECSTCGSTWESSWQLSDPFGTGAELIPPNINVSTYYDDTPNVYYNNSNGSYPNEPIQWHTAIESHTRIYSYVGTNTLPGVPAKVSCFRVFLPNGIMEEFGCTPDSIEYYFVPSNLQSFYIANWFLDLITDPQGNQIHITYQRDIANYPTAPYTNVQYTRDVVPATVEWDSPACQNTQAACTGSAWTPLMRVNFVASHGVARITGHPNGNPCNTGANLRCDDPLDYSGSGGLAAPQVQSTFVLNDIQVQVRTSGSASWNTLRDYQLSYEQSGPWSITDPVTGLKEGFAGTLDLTQIQEVGDTGGTALLYSGKDNSSTTSFAYMEVFDLSNQNIVVGPNTTLAYWIFPQSSSNSPGLASGSNSTCVAIDMIFTDGTDLRDSGAVDQNGNQLHPAHQCGHLALDQWNLVTSDIGTKVSGKTIRRIDVGYDQPANTGGYRGYIDDISLTNPDSSTPLFATDFESGSPQPTWTNTVDNGSEPGSGRIANVGGICCGLTGPEMGTRQELAHTDSSALPPRTFSYTWGTQHYEDTAFKATPSTNCGFSWNLNCWLWSRSLDGNSRYISAASNGLGLSQTFTWAEGRNNTHGVGGGDATNTLYCDSQSSSNTACNIADDENWSHMVLTSQSASVVRPSSSGSPTVTSTTSYSYKLTLIGAKPCGDCVAGMYWGNQNDGDFLDFYNAKYQGYTQATVTHPDGSVEVHKFYATDGWGIYDTNQVKCFTSSPCHNAPWWDPGTALHGREYEADFYDVDGTTLLKQVKTQYQVTCPPSGVGTTPASSAWGNWDGHLVSMLDHNNPVAVCDIQTSQVDTFTFDGAPTSLAVPHQSVTYSYDSFGRLISQTTSSNDGGARGGSPTTIVQKTAYISNDAVNASASGATGTYLIDFVAFQDTEDTSGNRYACTYTSYDRQGYALGQQSSLTLGEATRVDRYTNCGTAANGFAPSGQISTTTLYDSFGNIVGTTDADANAGIAGHNGCTVAVGVNRVDAVFVHASTCTTYDSTWETLPVAGANALDQTTSTGYSQTVGGGFGLWPTSSTDVNGQITTTTYDTLGRPTSTTLPGETSGLTTTTTSYTDWCSGTAAQTPCVEVDTTQRLDSTTVTTSRAFYDGWGNLVELRTPGPNGQDVVQYADYDPSGRRIFLSIKYFVPAYRGGPGPAAFATPDASQPGTSTSYPNLRTTIITDALSHATTTTISIVCGQMGDSACFVFTAVVDPLGHQQSTYTDALGRAIYTRSYTGNSASTYAAYQDVINGYDFLGHLVSTLHPNGTSATTFTYDMAGSQTGMSDPDRGKESYSYDPNGNLIESVDARGSSGTVFAGYDGLNRPLWRSPVNDPNSAFVDYSYDSTANGNLGVGHLTREHFVGGPGNLLSGIYNYVYDARGQQTTFTVTIGQVNYTTQTTYNDAGQVLSQTYPDGELVTTSYTPEGWLLGLTTQQGGTTTTLLSNASYSGPAGAAGKLTGANLGGGTYTYTASVDLVGRPTDFKYTLASNGTTLFESQPGYDAAGNVSSVKTTLPQGTDQQQFCYDEQNRLTWAGAAGASPCGTLTPGSLSAAQYTQSFTYDTLNRLTSGPLGSYTYGDSAHLDAATSIGSGYTASYDAAGNMICRAPTSSATCAGSSPTGAQLTYNAAGRVTSWQNAPSSPTTTDGFLYDGEGQRVEQQVKVNGVTSSTLYLGTVEEVALTPSGTTTTTAYYANGQRVALGVNGVISYPAMDVLGSPAATLDSSGHLVASQLYTPYGAVRYQSGTMPGSYGFTGQRADGTTGLDYYVARYYDPQAGQFTSADTVAQGGLNRYAYVTGNPETQTDATGHCPWCIAGAIIGAVVGGGIAYGVQVYNNYQHHDANPWGHVNWGTVALGAAGGALIGGTMGLAATYVATATAATTTSVVAADGTAMTLSTATVTTEGTSLSLAADGTLTTTTASDAAYANAVDYLVDSMPSSTSSASTAGGTSGWLKDALFTNFTNPWLNAAKSAAASAVGYGIACTINQNCSWATLATSVVVGAFGGFVFGRWLGWLGTLIASGIMTTVANAPTYIQQHLKQSQQSLPKATPTPIPTPTPIGGGGGTPPPSGSGGGGGGGDGGGGGGGGDGNLFIGI